MADTESWVSKVNHQVSTLKVKMSKGLIQRAETLIRWYVYFVSPVRSYLNWKVMACVKSPANIWRCSSRPWPMTSNSWWTFRQEVSMLTRGVDGRCERTTNKGVNNSYQTESKNKRCEQWTRTYQNIGKTPMTGTAMKSTGTHILIKRKIYSLDFIFTIQFGEAFLPTSQSVTIM